MSFEGKQTNILFIVGNVSFTKEHYSSNEGLRLPIFNHLDQS